MKDALILTLITAVAGLLLGYVHEITLEPIAQQELLTLQESSQEVFEEASSFIEDAEILEDVQAYIESEGHTTTTIDAIYYAYNENDTLLGYVIQVTNNEGYGGDITFLIGVQRDGTLNGISFTSIEETAGLGMNADTDDFKSQFVGIQSDSIAYTKTGASADNEIDALSGATRTTNAVTNGVNAGLCAYRYVEGGQES